MAVDRDLAFKAARLYARARWGNARVGTPVPVLGVDSDSVLGWCAAVARDPGVDPDRISPSPKDVRALAALLAAGSKRVPARDVVDARRAAMMSDAVGTVYVGADEDAHPLRFMYDGLPPFTLGVQLALAMDPTLARTDDPACLRATARGERHLFAEFRKDGKPVLRSVFDGRTTPEDVAPPPEREREVAGREEAARKKLTEVERERADTFTREVVDRHRAKWAFLRKVDEAYLDRITPAYVATAAKSLKGQSSRYIAGVPDLYWYRGCASTAAANVLAYWDDRGFDQLVDDAAASPEADLIDELADAMGTTPSGNTWDFNVDDGTAKVCEQHGYDDIDIDGPDAWGPWNKVMSAIDAGCPCVLLLSHHPTYGGHAVTVVGYRIVRKDCAMDDHFVTVHDTWGHGDVEMPFEGADMGGYSPWWEVMRITPPGTYAFVSHVSGFAKGWSLVAGSTNGGLLFYNASTGAGASARLDSSGGYHFTRNIPGFSAGWTHLVSAGNGGLLFYNAAAGAGATARVDGAGNYVFGSHVPGFARWSHIVGAANGGLLFYDASTGAGASAWLDEAGNYHFTRNISGFSAGWTHLVSAGNGGLLFYNAASGNGATARIDASGNYVFVSGITGFAQWTHIVGTPSGDLLFYNATTGKGALGRLDGAGHYEFIRNITGFGLGWTHIVDGNMGSLLFYNAGTGAGATARV